MSTPHQRLSSHHQPQLSTARDEEIMFTAETPMKPPPVEEQKKRVSNKQSPQQRFDEDAPAVASGAYKLEQNEDEEAPPKYDFEEMLKKAMQAEGQPFTEEPKEEEPVA